MESTKNNKTVLAAGFSGMVFFGVAFVIMGAVLPSLIQKFSLDTTSASTLAGLLPFGILLGSVIFGPVIDRFGYKALMIAASMITIAGLELLAFSGSVQSARFAIFLIGFGGGTLNGLTNALVSDISDDSARASNLSILGLFYTIGAVAIPLLFATLSKTVSYSAIVSNAGILMSLPIFYYLFVQFPDAKFKQGIPFAKVIALVKEPFLIILSFVLFFQSGLEGISNNWIPAYLEQTSSAARELSMYALTAIIVGIGAGRLLLGFLLRFISKHITLVASMFISATGIIILAYYKNPSFILPASFLLGLGFASSFPVILGEIGEKYKEMSGTAFSIALVIALTGNTLLNLLVGMVSLDNFHLIVLGSTAAIVSLYLLSLTLKK
ncbi:MAG: sugar MFS transporter [Bacteroidales bacterium]